MAVELNVAPARQWHASLPVHVTRDMELEIMIQIYLSNHQGKWRSWD